MHRILQDHRRSGHGRSRGLRLSHELSRPGKLLWSAGVPTLRAVGRVVFAMETRTRGPLPEGPFVVAANHFSHLDPPVVGAVIGRPIRFLAVDELQGVSWLLNRTISVFGSIPLTRTGVPLGAMRTALARLAAGDVVGLFPEGTRVNAWGDLEPKRGAAWLALRAGVPLVPVALKGTDRVFGVDNRLRWGRIQVSVGPALGGDDPDSLTRAWAEWTEEELASFSR